VFREHPLTRTLLGPSADLPPNIGGVQIEPFALERYYEKWEFRAELMLSSSDCESLTIGELLEFEPDARERLDALRLGYTEVAGSPELRAAVASRYELAQPGDILAMAAAEEGIFTAYHALLAPGDHVIVEAPCYGAAIEVARSTGADVSLWQRRHEDGWAHDLGALEGLLRPATKLIYMNSPHNPTGTAMTSTTFERLLEVARERSLVLFSDEVYRGLEHDPADRLPAACDVYEQAISLNTVSKAYGLPGLRIGWLACRDPELLARIRDFKLYTTICSSAPSELLLALALRHGELLVERSRELVLANLPLLAAFLGRHRDLFEWVRPSAGPIGFPRVKGDFEVQSWCERIAQQAGVLLLPGAVYDEPRHVRMGFGRANLNQALERLERHLA
jgi:aspartate/methionine/tyrosine aminotransferase